MKTIFVSAALAAVLMPAAAQAQTVPAAVIAVVDLEKVTSTCNACVTAKAALQSQVNALQAREKALSAPLDTEGKAIQAAVDALKGKDPDAALTARANAWQSKRQAAAQELSRQQTQIQRNQAYISQQIGAKLGPIYQSVMQRRGANVMLEIGSTLATGSTLDVSNDVLAALNAALPSVATTAPAAAAQPQSR